MEEVLERNTAAGADDDGSKCNQEDSAAGLHPHSAADNTANENLMQCGNLYLVFDYIEHDLAGLIDVRYKFNAAEIQCLMKQLFEALDYLHTRHIMHRDIKPSNILVSRKLKLQLADFGLARSTDTLRHHVPILGGSSDIGDADWCCDYEYHTPQAPVNGLDRGKNHDNSISYSGATRSGYRLIPIEYTNKVITLWYRPPELLLGAQCYGCSVDIWSAGCVFAELLVLRPLFPGKNESEQFDLISKVIGTPTDATWTDIYENPDATSMLMSCAVHNTNLRTSCTGIIPSIYLDVLERMLCADPGKRCSARLALGNRFFLLPLKKNGDADVLKIDENSSFHEYQTKKRKFDAMRDSKNKALSERNNSLNVGGSIGGRSISTGSIDAVSRNVSR